LVGVGITSEDAVTAVRTATGWLTTHDPERAALRRAARVTLAACIGFFVCRYAFDAPVMSTYAVFGAIATGVLSDVSGPPALRTRTFALALPVGLALVTIGTAAARSTVAAVVGMLVVGFLVAYSGVGGPRIAGLANGLQLFYILPCFPPYDPASLPQRLAGLTIGITLMATADRLVWPAPAPESFVDLLTRAIDSVARYIAVVRAAVPADADGPGADAETAVQALRPSSLPVGSRPTGPGRRDRGLTHAAAELLTMTIRTGLMARLRAALRNPASKTDADALLDVVDEALGHCSAALRGTGPPPKSGPVVEGISHYLDGRAERIAERAGTFDLPPVVRVGGLTAAVAESARGLVVATRAVIGAPVDPTAPPSAAAWYVDLPTPVLWWRRLRAHLTPRSVYFQNAVRLALGLAAARLVADLLDLSHGFWVLLATLTLMRTSLVASGLALVPAFLGTFAGAVVAAGVLLLIGDHDTVYAVVLPLAMVVAFLAGPLLGPAAGQFGFTIVVSVLFAQLAPASWRVAEVRLTDVVVGGLVGALIGAAVWPRGGGGEVRRSAAACLALTGDDLTATVRGLTGDRPPGAAVAPTQQLTTLFYYTYTQFRSEPGHQAAHDWLTVLGVLRRASSDAQALRERYPEPDALPWPRVTQRLNAAAEEIATAYGDAARSMREGSTEPPERNLDSRLDADPPHAPFADDAHAALRVVDAWGWLHGLAEDLGRAERAAAGRSK
jgi:uncharacterized membrane protein YccC